MSEQFSNLPGLFHGWLFFVGHGCAADGHKSNDKKKNKELPGTTPQNVQICGKESGNLVFLPEV